jgi:hypothetical protein
MKSPVRTRTVTVIFSAAVVACLAVSHGIAQNQPQASGACCTPETTAKLAASAGFIDIAGIKLGMPPQEALSAVKAENPAFKIDLVHMDANWDLLAQLTSDASAAPKKRWAYGIQGEVNSTRSGGGFESVIVTLTVPPNPQVAFNIARKVEFPAQAPPTVENIVAGLRKKYRPRKPHHDDRAIEPHLMRAPIEKRTGSP